MKISHKIYTVIIVLAACISTYEIYSYFTYRNIEVVDYTTLIKKAEYGKVTKIDLRLAAKYFLENHVCNVSSDNNRNKQCFEKLRSSNRICAKKHIDALKINDMNKSVAHEIIRRYKVCIEEST